jgi:hypothetical protein
MKLYVTHPHDSGGGSVVYADDEFVTRKINREWGSLKYFNMLSNVPCISFGEWKDGIHTWHHCLYMGRFVFIYEGSLFPLF